MKEQNHFCTVSDRFIYSEDVSIEMVYEFFGAKGWRCEARLVGRGGYTSECVIYTGHTIDCNDVSTLMRIHRTAVEDLLLALASLVALKKGESHD